MLLGRFDFHSLSSLLHAFQAKAFLILKSFSEIIMCEPRYLKSGTCFSGIPSVVLMEGSDADEVNSVLLALQYNPTYAAASSSACSRDSAFSTVLAGIARSSAKSRSVIYCAGCLALFLGCNRSPMTLFLSIDMRKT